MNEKQYQYAEVQVVSNPNKKKIRITSPNKPHINTDLLCRWQNILEMIAVIYRVPVAMITKIYPTQFKILLQNGHTSQSKEELRDLDESMVIYNKTVLAKREALQVIENLPSSNLEMKSNQNNQVLYFLGLPIEWPDTEIFGTIFILAYQEKQFEPQYHQMLHLFRDFIQQDLKVLIQNQELIALNLFYKDRSEKDSLTDLYNHKTILYKLNEEIKRAKRYQTPLSIVMCDLNDLKIINDTHGHLKGDAVLMHFANVLKNVLRETDYIGRCGGDEFLIIMPNTSAENAEQAINRIKHMLENHSDIGVSVSSSFGIKEFEGEKLLELIAQADRCMYEHKPRATK